MTQVKTQIIEQDEFEMLEKEMEDELIKLEEAAGEIEALAQKIEESMGLLDAVLNETDDDALKIEEDDVELE